MQLKHNYQEIVLNEIELELLRKRIDMTVDSFIAKYLLKVKDSSVVYTQDELIQLAVDALLSMKNDYLDRVGIIANFIKKLKFSEPTKLSRYSKQSLLEYHESMVANLKLLIKLSSEEDID